MFTRAGNCRVYSVLCFALCFVLQSDFKTVSVQWTGVPSTLKAFSAPLFAQPRQNQETCQNNLHGFIIAKIHLHGKTRWKSLKYGSVRPGAKLYTRATLARAKILCTLAAFTRTVHVAHRNASKYYRIEVCPAINSSNTPYVFFCDKWVKYDGATRNFYSLRYNRYAIPSICDEYDLPHAIRSEVCPRPLIFVDANQVENRCDSNGSWSRVAAHVVPSNTFETIFYQHQSSSCDEKWRHWTISANRTALRRRQ